MPFDNFEFDHSDTGTTVGPHLSRRTKTGIVAQMKAAARSALSPVKQARGKAIFSVMLVAAAALTAPQSANAQCYALNSATNGGLTLNITDLPKPTISSDGAGGTDYTYQLAGLSGNSATLVVGTKSYAATSPDAFGIQVDANPSFTIVEIFTQSTAPEFSATVELENVSADLLPDGWPAVLPEISQWPTVAAMYGIIGSSTSYEFSLTSITDCVPPPPPPKTLGDCDCNGSGVGEPIDAGTGNVFEKATDYKTAGQNPLSFARSYNSMGKTSYPDTFATSLGVNWRSSFDRYLKVVSSTSVDAERPDGQVISFTLAGGTWTPDSDVDVKLTQSGSNWTLTDHSDTAETYTVSGGKGTLNSLRQRNGYTQTLDYNSSGQLQSVTDSYDRALNFTYYPSGLLETVTTPDTLVLTYDFESVAGGNRLTSVSYNTSPVTNQTYIYGNAAFPFALTGITDENGNRFTTWGYDTNGRGNSSLHGTGAATSDLTTLTYNTDGTTTVTNAFGVQDTYSFTALQGVPKVSGIERAATKTTAAAKRSFGYDSNGYLNSTTDWNGNSTTYVNDAHGDQKTINEAVGSTVARTTTISYDPTWVHEPHQIITPGLTTTFAYDTNGNPHTRTDVDTTTNTVPYSTKGQTRITTWTWYGTGELESVKLPRTEVTAETSFIYATDGALTQIKDALGHLTKITEHTSGGLPTTIIDQNNVATTLAYDGRLNLRTSTLDTAAGKLVTTWTHDPANNLTGLQLPDNSKLIYGYDDAHRLTSITDLFGNSVTYTLDGLGDRKLTQIKTPKDAVAETHSGIFDALGRITSDIGGMGQTAGYTYDNNGNVHTITPPSPSGVITNSWDALNRLHTVENPLPGGTTTFGYDAHDRVLSVQDANKDSTTYLYNGFGDRTQTLSPDSGSTVSYFDGDRNVTQVVKPGPLTSNTNYDALDRPLKTTYPADATLNVSRAYDQTGHGFGIGQKTSATDQAGSLSLTYDERGNVTDETRVVTGAGTLATLTSYDNASRIAGIAYPSGTGVAYGRDIMGRVTSVMEKPLGSSTPVNVVTNVTYEPFGPETGFTFGNGIKGVYGYDLDYRPATRVDTGTAVVQKLTYAYYANNSVKTITDAVNAANTQTLGYNAVDALTSAVSGAGGYGTYGWTWDSVGNVKTQVVNGTTTTFNPVTGSNKLSSIVTGATTEAVASTPAGNINTLKIGTTTEETLNYNQANELATAQTASTSATYKYDLRGQRLEKALPGTNPVIYQYGQAAGELLSENDLHKGQTADYIYLNGRPIGEVNPTTGKLYFTHTDRLGTPEKLTDSTQTIVWNATYKPFGNTVQFGGTLTIQSLRLPGQYFDPETGMNHNGFRDYAGSLKRYVESDPIGLRGGMNTFQYAKGNAFKFSDPLGTTTSTTSQQAQGTNACVKQYLQQHYPDTASLIAEFSLFSYLPGSGNVKSGGPIEQWKEAGLGKTAGYYGFKLAEGVAPEALMTLTAQAVPPLALGFAIGSTYANYRAIQACTCDPK